MPKLAGPKRNGIGFAKKSSRRGNASGWPVRFSPSTARCRPAPRSSPARCSSPTARLTTKRPPALLEIALPVTLSRQQIREEDLSSALLQFRRRATQLGQLEDWFIFNGTYPSIELSPDGWSCVCSGGEGRVSGLPPSPCPSECLGLQSTGPYEWHPDADRGREPEPAARGHASAESRVVGVDRGSRVEQQQNAAEAQPACSRSLITMA